MYGYRDVSSADIRCASHCHHPQVRAANDFADLLKWTRPHLREQVGELQVTVARCQQTFDEARVRLRSARFDSEHDAVTPLKPTPACPQLLAAMNELNAATQALLELRHKGASRK